MNDDNTHSTSSNSAGLDHEPRPAQARLALVICWSGADQGNRVGEVGLLPLKGSLTLGRGDGDPGQRVLLVRQRPGRNEPTPPLGGKRISREQLHLSMDGSSIQIESVGRCPMIVRGQETKRARLAPGDTFLLRKELLLLVTHRPLLFPPLTSFPPELMPSFGEPDALGFVGESPLFWAFREQIAFAARRPFHVLFQGESGTGKELAARAIHSLSSRKDGPFVARNAATLPSGLIDAELFGNLRDYPNPGMRERPGLVGEADGGTLFLDEIGELPEELQVHLLRVLDQGGQYQRLGEGRPRASDLRFVGATNRGVERLKHDLLARFTLRLKTPPLSSRREDVPLLVQHLLREQTRNDPEVRQRFAEPGEIPWFRLAPGLIEQLVLHPYQTHTRELAMLLWQAIAESQGDTIEAPAAAPSSSPEPDPTPLTREAIEASLRAHGGIIEHTWKALGLKNRFVLMRLLKKHQIEP